MVAVGYHFGVTGKRLISALTPWLFWAAVISTLTAMGTRDEPKAGGASNPRSFERLSPGVRDDRPCTSTSDITR